MKRSLWVVWAVAACATAIVLWASCKGAEDKEKGNEPKVVREQIWISPEDSSDFITLFESYLEISQDYADSVAADVRTREYGVDEENSESAKRYEQNRQHIDSVMRQCVSLTKQGRYGQLLSMLEKERMAIYSHPGNIIDQEIGLDIVFSKLYNQVYPESKDSFYMKMLPVYEFTRIHIELLEKMGKGRHPFYDHLIPLIHKAKESVGTDSCNID